MLQDRRLLAPTRLPIALLLLALLIAGCGTPGAEAPIPEVEDQPVSTSDDAAADDYQAQREACSWETPCWPEIVEEVPGSFQEAPMLAEMVEAGDLPPVEERLPSQLLVIQPTERIGQYGGTVNRAFTGPGDRPNVWRWNNDHVLFWNTGATELRPRIARAWESNEDASEWTFYLREGMKWSDGEPFTADDFMFWYDYILSDEEVVPSPPWYMLWGGDLAVYEKVDDYTIKITFAEPFPAWPENMASGLVAGQFRFGTTGYGLFAPAHHLEQFHPDFVGEDAAAQLAEEAGFENWSLHLLAQNDPYMNPETPVVTPWKPVTRVADGEFVLERNPYFYAVDTEGNQLPYFDRIALELVEELEVLNLRAIAGNYTVQGRHIDFSKLPVFRENEEEGDYFVNFWGSSTRQPVKVAFNQDWNEDPEIGELLRNRDFRKALSLSIERGEINETFFLGVGKEASFCPQDTPPFFNSDRWDEELGRFDPEEANAILDELGLDERDSDGFRLLPSGERLTLRIDAVSGAFLDYPSIAERVAQMWGDHVGVNLTVNPVERSFWVERIEANQPMMNMFETGEWNPISAPRLLPSERWAPLAAAWAQTPDPDPAEYDGPQWIKDMVATHWEAVQEPDPDRRMELFIEGTEIMCDNHARLGIVVDVPVYTAIIKNDVRNVPLPMEWTVVAQTPGNGYPEQFFMLQDESAE